MKLDSVSVGDYETNCYILEKSGQVLVIDPGDEPQKIEPYTADKEIVGVLVTHGHSDHIGAIGSFDENVVYGYHNVKFGKNHIGPFEFEVIYTPGHTDDSITFYFESEGLMFTGDFLFKGTTGRMDLPTGSVDSMLMSLRKISGYPDAIVLPGHGPSTTLEKERENNIYFSKI